MAKSHGTPLEFRVVDAFTGEITELISGMTIDSGMEESTSSSSPSNRWKDDFVTVRPLEDAEDIDLTLKHCCTGVACVACLPYIPGSTAVFTPLRIHSYHYDRITREWRVIDTKLTLWSASDLCVAELNHDQLTRASIIEHLNDCFINKSAWCHEFVGPTMANLGELYTLLKCSSWFQVSSMLPPEGSNKHGCTPDFVWLDVTSYDSTWAQFGFPTKQRIWAAGEYWVPEGGLI